MNTPILIANILTLLAVVAHIFGADKELRIIQPSTDTDQYIDKQEKWQWQEVRFTWLLLILFVYLHCCGLSTLQTLYPTSNLS